MNFLFSFDIFTYNSFFNYQSNPKVASTPGSIFSLIVYAFLLYTFVISEMVQKTNPKISDQIVPQTKNDIKIELSNENFFPMISIKDIYLDEHYKYFDPSIWSVFLGMYNMDGSFIKYVTLVNCSDLLGETSYYNNISLCIENDTRMSLSLDNVIALTMILCSNSTDSDLICRPSNEIYDFVKGKFIQFIFKERTFDLNNFSDPIKEFSYPVVFSVSNPQFLEIYSLNLMQIEFQENTNWLFEDVQTTFYYQQEPRGTDFSFYFINYDNITADSANIFTLDIYLSEHKRVITRRYQQFVEVLGQLGGLLSVLKVVGGLFITIFPQLKIMKDLLNQLYLIQVDKNDGKRKNEEEINKNINNDKSIEMIGSANKKANSSQINNELIEEKADFDNPNLFPTNSFSKYMKQDMAIMENNNNNQSFRENMIKISSAKIYYDERFDEENKNADDRHNLLECLQNLRRQIKEDKLIFKFSFFSYFKHKIKLFFKSSLDQEENKIMAATQIYQKETDILSIFQRMQDIEKLKMVLLTEEQRKLFDLIKPSIVTNSIISKLKNEGKMIFSKRSVSLQLKKGTEEEEINEILNLYEQKIKMNGAKISEIDRNILIFFSQR